MGTGVRVEEEVRGRGPGGVPNRHIHTHPLLTVPTNRHQDYFMRFADPIPPHPCGHRR